MNKISKSSINVRIAPFVMAVAFLFSVAVAQPTHAASIVNTVRCASLTLFASASVTAMQVSETAMETAFELNLNVMQAGWQLEDSAVTALRQVGESAFVATLNAFANRPGVFIKNTEYRTASLQTYKTTMLDALHLHENNIDAARASYHEDMLAIVKAHQKVLSDLVNGEIGAITSALDVAKQNCSVNGVVLQLTGAIAAANLKLLNDGAAEEVKSISKALSLVGIRNAAFLKEETQFAATSLDATAKLTAAFLTRQ